MKKMIFTLMALMLTTMAMGQTSTPGDTDGTANYNSAYQWISVDTPVPDQVAFTLPQANFDLDLAHVVPNNVLTLRIAVTNNTDRPIDVSDNGFFDTELLDLGFSGSAPTKRIGANTTDYFTYTIGMPNASEIAFIVANKDSADFAPNGEGGGGYYAGENVFRIVTQLVAVGVLPTADTTATFD